MAPKKESAGPAVDNNPFGAFVNVQVAGAHLALELPPEPVGTPRGGAAKPAKPGAPAPTAASPASVKLHLSLALPGPYAPVVGAPTDVRPGVEVVPFAFEGRTRREPTLDALHEILNGVTTLGVFESSSNVCLASATLDLLELGLGASSLDLGSVTLIPSDLSANPADLPKVTSGSLQGVRLFLTHRPSSAASEEQNSRPSSSASQRAKTPTAGGGAGNEADLSAPDPFSFVPADSNVVELQVGGIRPIPAGLLAAATAASEGKNPGRMAVIAVLLAPGGGKLAALTSGLVDGTAAADAGAGVVFRPGAIRVVITRQQATALLGAVDSGQPLLLELARRLTSDTLTDPACEAYRAVAELPGAAALLEPGTTCSPVDDGTLLQPPGPGNATALPPYVPSGAKGAKPVEEAPAPGTCLWVAAGSCLYGVQLRLARPLVPAWSPPPAPPVPLIELVPARPNLKPFTTPSIAQETFQAQVAGMARAVERVALDAAARQGKVDAGALKGVLAADGRLQLLQATVKHLASRVAHETLHKDLDGHPLAPPAAQAMLSELHARLAAGVQAAVDADAAGRARPDQASAPHDDLQRLAEECEAAGWAARGEALHQQRVLAAEAAAAGALDPAPASAWHAYAAFLLRRGAPHHGRAEQALRQALRWCPSHGPSCAGLSALLLHVGSFTDALYLKEAGGLARMLAEAPEADIEQQALGWGLLLLSSRAAGDQGRAEDAADALAGLQRCEADGVNGLAGVAELAAEAALASVALDAAGQARQELPNSCGSAAAGLRLHLAAAQAWAWTHAAAATEDAAASALQQCIDHCDATQPLAPKGDVRAALLKGRVLYQAQEWRRCAAVYVHQVLSAIAARRVPTAAALRVFIQLAECYTQLGHTQQAHNVYAQACQDIPSSAMAWVGLAATAPAGADDASGAVHAALAQALACDPDCGPAWAFLGLQALRHGQANVAALHVRHALELQLADKELLQRLGEACEAGGLHEEAAACSLAAIHAV